MKDRFCNDHRGRWCDGNKRHKPKYWWSKKERRRKGWSV